MFEVRYCVPEVGWKVLMKTDDFKTAKEMFTENVVLDIELGIKESWIQLVNVLDRVVILEYLGE